MLEVYTSWGEAATFVRNYGAHEAILALAEAFGG